MHLPLPSHTQISTQNKTNQKASKWLVPVTSSYHDSKFFVREDGKLKATPLLLVLISIEFSDVVFAIDSVPAAFGYVGGSGGGACVCVCVYRHSSIYI